MSSKPYPDGVREVIALLAEIESLAAEATQLRPQVARLKEVEEQAQIAGRKLQPLLRSMDVEAPGNWGWERRMAWFLAEMRRQLLAQKEAES